MATKVDFLLKGELEYELLVRGINVGNSEKVLDLRKKLREVIRLGVQCNYLNLNEKIDTVVESELIESGLENLEVKVASLTDPPSLTEVSRIETRLVHYDTRVKFLAKFKLDDIRKELLSKLKKNLEEITKKFKEVKYDEKCKELVERKISESNIEQENLDEVFEVNANDVLNNPTRQPADSIASMSMYNKLPNPAERHFKNLKVSDGLNARELLKFLSTMLKIKDETEFNDCQILDLSLSYVSGPLYAKVIECKNANMSIDDLHVRLIDYFIPIGLRENLKRELVTRPQKMGEPLNVYILEVKENAKLLRTCFSEKELVELIKIGLNPETRSRLVFMSDPQTFEELSHLCIHDQNVRFEDIRRRNVRPPPFQARGINVVSSPKKCYVCGKLGHIAKYCYSQGTRSHEPRSRNTLFDKISKTDPKNGALGRGSATQN